MTSILEKTLAIIAPYRCLICSNYNNIVCDTCILELPNVEITACVLCGGSQTSWRICTICSKGSALDGVWVAGEYQEIVKQLVRTYKFDHARAAYKPLACYIAQILPYLNKTWLVTTIPTATSHIRARSFDHALLLAQEVAQQKGLFFAKTLLRKQNVQQVGENRAQRFVQAQQMFELHPRSNVMGKKVLVVDDVCTTGATLSAAAAILKRAGAREVWGGVVAWRRLEK